MALPAGLQPSSRAPSSRSSDFRTCNSFDVEIGSEGFRGFLGTRLRKRISGDSNEFSHLPARHVVRKQVQIRTKIASVHVCALVFEVSLDDSFMLWSERLLVSPSEQVEFF